MTRWGLTTTAALATIGVALLAASGCELAVPFDRSLIDASLPGQTSDATADVAVDTSTKPPAEAGIDAAPEAGGDAGTCSLPSDCPTPANECVTATCASQVCGTTNAFAGTTCTSGGGKVCDGNGKCVACTVVGDCPAQLTACLIGACTSHACGATNASSGAACTDNGGKLCDGSGKCVACLAPTDCPAQTTVCKINACDGTAHTCGTTNAAKGTTCTDNGGTVCDGNGACVATHCTDGVKDANETDVDCGGSCGPTCKDTGPQQKCLVGGDCISGVCDSVAKTCTPPSCTDGVMNGTETDTDCGGATCDGLAKTCADRRHCAANADCANNQCFGSGPGTCVSCVDGVKDGNETDLDCGGAQCDALSKTCAPNQGCGAAADCQSGYCQPNNTCALRPDGQACTSNGQCAHGNCVGNICCNSACNGTCQACTTLLTGQATGTCGSITPGLAAPAGQCAVSTTCGNDGKCGTGGTCEQRAPGVSCGSTSCTGGQLTAIGSCSGGGACNPGSTAACPGGFICADPSTCKTACGGDGDCQLASTYCANPGLSGTCVAKGNPGAACVASSQCVSGICGTAGTGTRCCTAACSPIGGSCGATDCSITGACVFALVGKPCSPASCLSGQFTTAGACDGNGGCGAGTTAACAGGFICADPSTCKTACGGDGDCQGTANYCLNPGATGTCVPKLGPTSPCTADNECINGTCNGAPAGTCN